MSMSAVLGTDGRFLSSGVPSNAELIFTRADVHAKLTVVRSPNAAVIELSSHRARYLGGYLKRP
jgi:hypothetical protein